MLHHRAGVLNLGAPFRMAIGTGAAEELRAGAVLPALVSVRLTPEVDRRDRRYSAEWGWMVGVGHTIIVYAFPDDRFVEVGDPSFGRERWGIEALRDLYVGRFITLEARDESD